MRPRTGRLVKIEDSIVENGERLKKIEDILEHLQTVLDDIQANQDADEPNSDQGKHNGAASVRVSMPDKLWLKERITAWKSPNIRAIWILCGEKPKECGLSRVQLQGEFTNTALASSAVVEQINPFAGHNVTAFMPRGGNRALLAPSTSKSSSPFWRRCCFSSSGGTLLWWGERRGWSYARHSRTVSTW